MHHQIYRPSSIMASSPSAPAGGGVDEALLAKVEGAEAEHARGEQDRLSSERLLSFFLQHEGGQVVIEAGGKYIQFPLHRDVQVMGAAFKPLR